MPTVSRKHQPLQPTRYQRITRWGVSLVLLIAAGVLLVVPILAWQWVHRPFPGLMLEQTLVVGGIYDQDLPPGVPPNPTARLIAVGDQPVTDGREVDRILQGMAFGDQVKLTFERPDGSVLIVPVTLTTFPLDAWLSLFWVPYLTGLIYLLTGLWVFRYRHYERSGQTFAFFAACVALAVGLIFDLNSTHRFVRLWVTAMPLVGASLIHLALIFPEERSWSRRRSLFRFFPYPVAIALALAAHWRLYDLGAPWAYITTWRRIYAFLFISLIFFLVIMGYVRARTLSSVVRQQVRIILVGSLLAFAPMAVYLLLAGVGVEPAFHAVLYLPPLILFPLFIAYAILRYKLLGMDPVIGRGLAYTILIAAVIGVYVLILAAISRTLGIALTDNSALLIALLIALLVLAVPPLRRRAEEMADRILGQRRVDYRAALQDYSRELVTTPLSLPAILDRMMAQIEPVSHGAPTVIFLYDPHQDRYTLRRSGGLLWPEEKVELDPDSPLVRWLDRQDEPVYLLDPTVSETLPLLAEQDRRLLDELGLVLFLPLRGQRRLAGWVALGPRLSGEPYTPDDVHFLAAVTDQTAMAVENAQLLADLEERIVHLDALRKIGEAVDLRRDLEDLLSLIYEQTHRILGVDNFYVALYDEDRQEFRMAYYVEEGQRREPTEPTWPLGTGLTSQIVRDGRPIVTDDYLAECARRRIPHGGRPAKAWLGVPLISGPERKVVGVLNVSCFREGYRYTAAQVRLMEAIADQAAVAIGRMRLYQEMKARAAELATLYEVSRTINSTLDLPSVLDLIMNKVVEILDVEAGSLLLLDEESGDLVFQVALGTPGSQELVGRHHPVDRGIVGHVVQSGQAQIVNDVRNNPHWDRNVDREISFTTRDILCVPLTSRDRIIGVIEVLNHRDGSPFRREEADLLTGFAAQAAVAIENARLYTQTDQALARRVEELSTLQRIDRDLNAALDFDRLMNTTIKWAMRITKAPVGIIALYDKDRQGLLLLASRGYPPGMEEFRHKPWPLNKGIIGRVVRTGEPALVDDVSQDPDYHPAQPTTRSQLAVPIHREGQVIGVINLESPEPAAFDRDDLTFLQRMADHAAIAFENARLYQESQRRAEDMALLYDISLAINAHLELGQVLDALYERIRDVWDPPVFFIALYDEEEDSLDFAIYVDRGERVPPFRQDLKEQSGFSAWIVRNRKPLLIRDWEKEAATSPVQGCLIGDPTRSWLGVPLLIGERLIGVMAVQDYAPNAYGQDHLRFLSTIAGQVAIALENARLHEGVRQANRAKSEFIDFVAHELKQPMTAMQGYAKMLTMGIGGELTETQRQFVDVITSNVDRMGKLVQDLLEISRLEAGRTKLKLAPVSLADVVAETVMNTRTEIEARHHTLEVDVPEDLPPVRGDRERLVQILTNLVSNAYKYTPDGGRIRIIADGPDGSDVPEGYLRVRVEDTGIGMTPQEIAKLDEKFFRADHDLVQKQPGTGLGVSITRNLVELHGGEFFVESEPGKGSTFAFTVPIAQEERR